MDEFPFDAEFPLKVGDYAFKCYYQRGALHGGTWKKSPDGKTHVAVCKCGRGVFGISLDDVVDKLRRTYAILRPNEHFHWEDTTKFNVILGFDGTWIMGTIQDPGLLGDLEKEVENRDQPSPAKRDGSV